mmetsp:Transcript_94044/g.186452  ORF Transcript_94044/g.186452 Transcript_94044/m.186452 type:complete len:105 (+) Transcript_94044:62-376(+)|eukprot:CAMPEP_0172655098 /NCGR_PEP_ID=MMETSP1074-20121228/405_1 /TAXON_ID=2916 /ORGANISM="Ceratium fusus, Strain PA161109" /LENGTH=104 /DNA_ID=CAMNT_0013469641 /DNA_START=63 /DNA_END=377 /DNA_ORIENTATION=-
MQLSFGAVVGAALVAVGLGSHLRATPAPTAGAHTGFDHDQYGDDWGNEWKSGNFPSYKKTQKKTYFNSADYEDSQSDGKPSKGLTGDKVGAYLPATLPQGHGVF